MNKQQLELTCNFLIAEPSWLKCNSFAMAEILEERFLLRTTLCLFGSANEEMDVREVNLSEDDESFLSITRLPGAARVPIEDMAVKVEAIYPLSNWNRKQSAHHQLVQIETTW